MPSVDRVSADQVIEQLKAVARPGQLEGMARYGMAVDVRLGVAVPEMRRIAKGIGKDHELALALWDTGIAEARILASMVDLLNRTRRLNIITLEDPIEHIHASQKSLVVQREVGTHVDSFANGLRAALREDPDVILVGELRDPETIMMAMTAA